MTFDTLMENSARFGFLPAVVQASSNPWPDKIRGLLFASAFIDGDHWGDGPWLDWLNVKECTTGYVVFDNDDDLHPDVQSACTKAGEDPEWEIILRQNITCVLKRKVSR